MLHMEEHVAQAEHKKRGLVWVWQCPLCEKDGRTQMGAHEERFRAAAGLALHLSNWHNMSYLI
jgi:hypothetical protein